MKPSKCKVCREEYRKYKPMQTVCGPVCAEAAAVAKRVKGERKADAETRLRIKTRAQWLHEAQAAFNSWVRARDADRPCVSCGRMHGGQWHAGHYLSTGARPELRFEPDNVHRQCQPCNTHLHGNLLLYRAELIRRIGVERVDWLEGPHTAQKYTIEELNSIKAKYSKMARDIRRDLA